MELSKLDSASIPMEGGLLNWLLFLKGTDKSNWEVLQMNEPTLKKAMPTLEFLSQDREARRRYEERQKFLHDEASALEWAAEKGMAQGMAQGIAQGERNKALQIARNLLSMEMEIKAIAQASGLTEKEVLALKSQK